MFLDLPARNQLAQDGQNAHLTLVRLPRCARREKAPKRPFLVFRKAKPQAASPFSVFKVDDLAQLWHIYVNAERSVCNTK